MGTKNPRTNEIIWHNLGIFLINNPDSVYSASERTLNFEGLDLMAKLTGKRNGQLIAPTTQIAFNTKIATAVQNIIEESGFNNYIIDDVGYTVPYDIKKDSSSTTYDLLSELRDLYPDWEMFFDVDGVFHWQEIPDGKEQPIILDFDSLEQPIIINEKINVDFENVKNNIIIYGKLDDLGKQVYATTSDELEDSPFNVNKIGLINYVLTDETIYTDYLAALRANYELYLHSRLNDAIDLEIVPIYWLNDVNVKIKRNNEVLGIDGEYLIQKIEIPLGIGETMKINASKIYDDWQFKPSEDFISASMSIVNVANNSITVNMHADSLSNIKHIQLIATGSVILDESITEETKTYDREYTIVGLSPNTYYKIIFTATNEDDKEATFEVNVKTKESKPVGTISVQLNVEEISSESFKISNTYSSTYPISKANLKVIGEEYEYVVSELRDSYTIEGLSPETAYTATLTLTDIYDNTGEDSLIITTDKASQITGRIALISLGSISYNNRIDWRVNVDSSSSTIKNTKLTAKWKSTGETQTLLDYTSSSVAEKSSVTKSGNVRNDAIIDDNVELSLVATDDNNVTSTYNLEVDAKKNQTNTIEVQISEPTIQPVSEGKYNIIIHLKSRASTSDGGDYIYYYLGDTLVKSYRYSPFGTASFPLVHIDEYMTISNIEMEKNINYKFRVEVRSSSTSSAITGYDELYIRA